MAISFSFLQPAAFGQEGTVKDNAAHYPANGLPEPIWTVSAGGRSFEFEVEIQPIARPSQKDKPKRTPTTVNRQVDEFIELANQEALDKAGEDVFSDFYQFPSPVDDFSKFAMIDGGQDQFSDCTCPTLSGFCDGPPVKRREAFPPSEVLNIIFSRPSVSRLLVEGALAVIAPARKVRLTPVLSAPIFTSKTALPELLKIAERIKIEPQVRVLQYSLWVSGKDGGAQKTFAWGNVFAEKAKEPILAELFARAAVLERSSVRSHFYLGSAACYREDWDEAWRQFQKVYKNSECDAEMTREIVKTYRDTGERNLEMCIWLTRYLKVAKDWDSFELAYEERERIEYESYLLYLSREPGSNFAWPVEKLPLKVFFDLTEGDDLKLKTIVEDSLGDWTRSTGGKIDFVETADRKKADLFCKWEDDPPRYSCYEDSAKAPVGLVRPRALADTDVEMGKQGRKATIRFHGDGCGHQYLSDEQFKSVSLHETGHALGIYLHLSEPDAIMYAFGKESDAEPELTNIDKETICRLYKKHPVNQSAVMKFVGQVAACRQWDEAPAPIEKDAQLSSASAPSGATVLP